MKALKLALVNDFAEILATDIPLFETENNAQAMTQKFVAECDAMAKIKQLAGGAMGDEIEALWYEHEHQLSFEAKIVKAIDKLEAQIQHNQADMATWTEWEKGRVYSGKLEEVCSIDPVIMDLCNWVLQDAKQKIDNDVSKG